MHEIKIPQKFPAIIWQLIIVVVFSFCGFYFLKNFMHTYQKNYMVDPLVPQKITHCMQAYSCYTIHYIFILNHCPLSLSSHSSLFIHFLFLPLNNNLYFHFALQNKCCVTCILKLSVTLSLQVAAHRKVRHCDTLSVSPISQSPSASPNHSYIRSVSSPQDVHSFTAIQIARQV